MMDSPVTLEKTKAAWLLGVAAGIWGGWDPLVHTLCYLIFLDILSGFLVARSGGTINSDASFRGMGKKAMMLVLVGAAHTYNATQPLGFNAGVAVAGFFCTTEFISIIENAGRLGLPIPRVLMEALEKLQGRDGERRS